MGKAFNAYIRFSFIHKPVHNNRIDLFGRLYFNPNPDNPFYAMEEFRLVGPPGAWIASVAFFGIASLWGICLALVALFTRARNT